MKIAVLSTFLAAAYSAKEADVVELIPGFNATTFKTYSGYV